MTFENTQAFSTSPAGVEAEIFYKLPYENAVLEAFIRMANHSQAQANFTKDACLRGMEENKTITADFQPASSNTEDPFVSGVVTNTRSLLLAAEAACQAQTSVCEALFAAQQAAEKQKAKLQHRIAEISQEIDQLNQKAAALRISVTKATDSSQVKEAYATDEAKQLLNCLEEAYQKHTLGCSVQEHQNQTEANLNYIIQESATAKANKNVVEQLLHDAEAEWQRIAALFQLDASAAQFSATSNPSTFIATQTEVPTETATTNSEKEERPSAWGLVWTYTKILLVAFLVAMVLRAYVFDITRVEGVSMYPTLQNGDNLVTSKISYILDSPQRGDIVVLQAPDAPGQDYIKRIVAVPNDEIQITGGKVYLNGELLNEPYLKGMETLGDIHTVVPTGFYFVMGDNRAESRDSRSEGVGFISIDNITGKSVLRLYPFSSFGSLD